MGQQIFYCQSCGNRVTGEDLQAGGAQRTTTRIRCAECARKKTQRKPAPTTPVR
jgi:DNA-directed RNA polymerase subunit RPC12/RpoP